MTTGQQSLNPVIPGAETFNRRFCLSENSQKDPSACETFRKDLLCPRGLGTAPPPPSSTGTRDWSGRFNLETVGIPASLLLPAGSSHQPPG